MAKDFFFFFGYTYIEYIYKTRLSLLKLRDCTRVRCKVPLVGTIANFLKVRNATVGCQ